MLHNIEPKHHFYFISFQSKIFNNHNTKNHEWKLTAAAAVAAAILNNDGVNITITSITLTLSGGHYCGGNRMWLHTIPSDAIGDVVFFGRATSSFGCCFRDGYYDPITPSTGEITCLLYHPRDYDPIESSRPRYESNVAVSGLCYIGRLGTILCGASQTYRPRVSFRYVPLTVTCNKNVIINVV